MNPISLASGVLPEFGPLDIIHAACGAAFDAVGLWVEPAEWTKITTREVRAALSDTGLPLLDVEVIWLKPGSAMDDHRKVIDVGADLGAANALCVSSDPDHHATAARFAELCEHAEGSGMRLSLEFGIFTEVKTFGDALAILQEAGHRAGAVLIDPIHVDRSATPIDAIARVDRSLLPYAQMCDAIALRPDPTDADAVIVDAIDLREHCGEGELPLATLYRALPPDIPLSIELRSKALRDRFPEPVARAREVANKTRKWLRHVSASTGADLCA